MSTARQPTFEEVNRKLQAALVEKEKWHARVKALEKERDSVFNNLKKEFS